MHHFPICQNKSLERPKLKTNTIALIKLKNNFSKSLIKAQILPIEKEENSKESSTLSQKNWHKPSNEKITKINYY